MEYLYFLFLFLFAVAAYDDHRRHKIHNLIPACLWTAAGLSGHPSALPVLAFGFLFLVNTLTTMKWNVQILMWGDILIIPMFLFGVCFLLNKAIVVPFFVVGCFAPLIMSAIRKKKVAVAPILFLFYLMAGIAYLL
jgi:hypothetical protein